MLPKLIHFHFSSPGEKIVLDKITAEINGETKIARPGVKGAKQQKAFCIGLLLTRLQFERLAPSSWTKLASTTESSWARTLTDILTRHGFRSTKPAWWEKEIERKFGALPFPLGCSETHVLRFVGEGVWSPDKLRFLRSDSSEIEGMQLLEMARALEKSEEDTWEEILPSPAEFSALVQKITGKRERNSSTSHTSQRPETPLEKNRFPSSPPNSKSNGDLLERYLLQVALRNGSVQPLGSTVSFTMDELPIDLPLKLTYAHPRLGQPSATPGANIQNVEATGQKLWRNRVQNERASGGNDAAKERIWRLGDRLLEGTKMIVVGDPGCGKSTLLSSLAWFYALHGLAAETREKKFPGVFARIAGRNLPGKPWVPILVSFKNCADLTVDGLKSLVAKTVTPLVASTEVIPLTEVLFERLCAGTAVLLVDGIDELAEARRQRALSAALIKDARGWPAMPIVASSRWIGFTAVGETLRECFDSLNVNALDDPERKSFVQSLVKKLGLPPQTEKKRIHEIERQVCQGGALAAVCDSVILLSQVVSLSAPAQTPPHCKAMVFRRTIAHLIEQALQQGATLLVEDDVLRKLAWLADQMHKASTTMWAEPDIVECLRRKFWPRSEPALNRSRFNSEPQLWLDEIIERTGLLHVGGTGPVDENGDAPRIIQFYHPLLQEYFVGRQLNQN